MSKILSLIGTMFTNTPESKGKQGELKTSLVLSMAKNSQDYTVFDDVTLHTDDNATTQIDHIVISRFGVFVLEVKNYDGFIYGSEEQYQWTQVLNPKSKYKFLNPLIQNKKHVTAVQRVLDISDEQIFSIVVFMGKATFKTPMPDNVVQLIDLNRKLRAYQTTEYFTKQQCHAFSQKIRNRMLDQGTLAKTVHLANLEKKRQPIKSEVTNHEPAKVANADNTGRTQLNQTIQTQPVLLCPRCQSRLILRTVKKGENQGKQFYGCSNFPKCRFISNKN